jgi:hypothetical protein
MREIAIDYAVLDLEMSEWEAKDWAEEELLNLDTDHRYVDADDADEYFHERALTIAEEWIPDSLVGYFNHKQYAEDLRADYSYVEFCDREYYEV